MKIYNIAVFTDEDEADFSASLQEAKLEYDPANTIANLYDNTLKKWREKPNFKFNTPIAIPGEGSGVFYYAIIYANKKIIVFATDQNNLGNEKLNKLFNAMNQANNDKELGIVLQKPDEIAKTKIERLSQQVEEVKDVMLENIDKAIARGESLNDLADKTDQLHMSAFYFNKSARKLNNRCCLTECISSLFSRCSGGPRRRRVNPAVFDEMQSEQASSPRYEPLELHTPKK